MNISKENIDALNAVIKLTIDKQDYEQRVEDVLKNYRKKVNMPGFRPGHVPAGMIKKMYGNMALVDEVNKLVSEKLFNYIKDNNLNILGEPIPSKDQKQIDFDQDSSFEFLFDIAIAPEVSVDLSKIKDLPYYNITITDDMVDGQVKNMTSRFGKNENVDSVGEKSMVKGVLTQLDANNQPLEGGIVNDSTVMSLAIVKDEAEKAKLTGAKVGDMVIFDPKVAFPNDTELSYLLKVSKDQVPTISGNFGFTINEITEFKDAELTQEIFDKTFGEGAVKNEEEFRARVKENLAQTSTFESDYRFSVDARKSLTESVKVDLPEEFLKRWMITVQNSEKKVTPEQIEAEMPRFLEDLRWQMIKNSIIKANDLKVDNEAVLAFARKSARMQFAQYGLTNIPDEHIDSYATDMLKNEEQRNHFVEGAANDVAVAFIKSAVKLTNKEISRADFNKLFEE
jgi:trigger factor